MINKIISPIDILYRELHRLDNDVDRLQMLVTLKSHLNNLQFTSNTFQLFFSIFNDEQYRLQAINQLIPFIYTFITSDSLTILLKLFTNNKNRLNLIETLKNYEPLKSNKEVNEILLNEYRQYFHMKKIIQIPENPKEIEPNIPITQTSNVAKVLSNTSGVFEKAKQFVCRVFGGGSSSSSSLNEQCLINEINSLTDNTEQKKFHNSQFQPTSISLSTSQSYTSIITKSPPSSPIITDQSSLPIQSIMVTQIHSILDNIDSVLDKIEAQTNSVIQRPIFNENSSTSNSFHISEELSNTSDQITQTLIEHDLNLNNGSGDTILFDIIEESNSIISSEESEEMLDNFY